jgi:hypothetical protein
MKKECQYCNEKLERKMTYDQVKRKRKFQTSWQKKRMFHTYDIPSYDPTDAMILKRRKIIQYITIR